MIFNFWVNYPFKHFCAPNWENIYVQLKAKSQRVQYNYSSQVLQRNRKYFKTVTFCGLSSKPHLLPEGNIRARLAKSRCLILFLQLSTNHLVVNTIFLSFSLVSLNSKASQFTFGCQSHLLFVFKFSPRIKQVQLQREQIPAATLHTSPWALRGPRCSKITWRNLPCIQLSCVCMAL